MDKGSAVECWTEGMGPCQINPKAVFLLIIWFVEYDPCQSQILSFREIKVLHQC